MNLDKIPKSGTTISRKRFWDKARDIVLSLQKKAGRNVSVDERQGFGTVINVIREQGTSGSCFCDLPPDCDGDEHNLYFTFDGITIPCNCIDFTYLNPDTSRFITATELDGTILTNCSFFGGRDVWSGVNEDVNFDFDAYQDSICSDLQISDSSIPSVIAWCDGSDLIVALTDNISVMFYGRVCALDTSYDNELACYQQFDSDTIPPAGGFGKSIGCAEGGTVTVSLSPP